MAAPYIFPDEGNPLESQLPVEAPPSEAPPPEFWRLFPETQAATSSETFSGMFQSSGTAHAPPVPPFHHDSFPVPDESSPGSPIPQRKVARTKSEISLRTDCQVTWSFYIPAAAPTTMTSASTSFCLSEKKRNRSPYQHIVPFGEPVFVKLLQGTTLEDFKEYVVVVMAKKLDTLGQQASDLNVAGELLWTGFIDRGGEFAMGRNRVLGDDDILEQFCTACGKATGKRIGIKLSMIDPLKTSQSHDHVDCMKKALTLSQGPIAERQSLQHEVERVAANGDADRSPVMNMAATLIRDHTNYDSRFPAETAIIVKPDCSPSEPVQYLDLSFNMSYVWAEKIYNDRDKVDGVTKDKLPDERAFKAWKTLTPAKSAPNVPAIPSHAALHAPGSGVHSAAFPLFACGYNPCANGYPAGPDHPVPVAAAPIVAIPDGRHSPNPASPTPEAENALDVFFAYAHVDSTDEVFEEVMLKHKITYHYFFENSSMEELSALGFAMGPAKLLFRAAKKFSAHLKALAMKA